MRAHDLARPYPTVFADDDALDAARLVVREQLPALLVVDRDEYPYAVVPSARVISALLPSYMREEPVLAAEADDRCSEGARESMTEWLPRGRIPPPVVGPDTSPAQITALMARKDTPVVAVVERDGAKATLIGAVTVAALLEHFLGGS
ncbi:MULTISPECIES: CBS domain-containing protein [unclassified Streptomyces]|uniref:CBS domain-containing protein n=1 Tax=unclassified Streptomyces TaxID=2593676 RepID=UPI00386BBF8F|nr:CBS domain-containing protein [Streptomyces sp. NBC_00827]